MAVKQRARNVGSNYTTFRYAGKPIAYLMSVTDSGQTPVGAGSEFVHPLGHAHPTEIVTARAINGGTLSLTIQELWHEEIWQQLQGLARANDIIEVFRRLANTGTYITCTKIINPPDGRRYGKTYHRCTITQITDGETFDLGTLSVPKRLQIAYTHTTPL